MFWVSVRWVPVEVSVLRDMGEVSLYRERSGIMLSDLHGMNN